MFISFILGLLVSLPAFSYTESDLVRLSNHPKWIKLLHYKRGVLGGYTSEADGLKFFLHQDGKTNPLEELRAAVSLFESEIKPQNDHAICKFPLRYKWINRELGGPWKADFSGCEKYIEFFSKLAAKRATIVFSSYYLSNPNSAFGHTLMRLSRYDDRNETEMLDYGINYSAQATATNPLTYAVMGLFGGFKGKFAAIPYYYKVREYSNSEFRDLWSYDLNLTLPQVLEMVDHIWELGDTWFDYFYFQENCSYHLLSVIDVAVPEKDLTSHYPLFTIPADTIRGLKKEGMIGEGRRRESTYSKLIRLSEGLSTDSLKKAKEISESPESTNEIVAGIEDKKAADILDVAMEAYDYFHAKEILSDEARAKKEKAFILSARARNPHVTEDTFRGDDQTESPALSHAPTRFSLSQGYEDNLGRFNRFEIRTSFHDMLDPPRGSLKSAQIEMGKLSLNYLQNNYENQKLRVDHFSVVSLRNFQDQTFWASPFSWEIDLGLSQIRQNTCLDCPAGYFLGSIGNSVSVFNEKLLFSFLINGELNWQNFYQDGYRLGLGPKFYVRYKASDRYLTAIEGTYHWNTYRPSESFKDHQTIVDWENRYHLTENFSLSWKNGGLERENLWQLRTEFGLQYFY